MGAASSKNVAKAVTNVSNYVSNSTEADNDQVTNVYNTQEWNDCAVYGDVTIKNLATIQVSSEQIASGIQNTDLQNDISQQMMQQAQSTVGSMGIGYANASNSASVFANASSTVTNSVKASSNQAVNTFNDFNCNHSNFYGDVTIDNVTDASYLSSQTLHQEATTDIVNQVSQSVTQKATAKVEGLAGFLLALALCIVALGVGFGGALAGAGKAAKPLLIAGTALGLACLMAWMWLSKAPPLFSEEDDCCPVDLDMGGCDSPCINQKVQKVHLKTPPLKYCYSLYDQSVTASNPGALISMAVAANKGVDPTDSAPENNNGGYNALVAIKVNKFEDDTAEKYGITKCPPLMFVPTKGDDITDPKGNVFAIDPLFVQGGGCTPGIMSVSAQVDKSASDSDRCNLSTTGTIDTLEEFIDPATQGTVTVSGDTPTIYELTSDSQGQILAQVNASAWQNYLTGNGDYPEGLAGDDDTLQARSYHARYWLCKLCGVHSVYVYTNSAEEVEYVPPENPDITVIGRPEDDSSKWWQREGGNLKPFNQSFDPKKYAYRFSGFGVWSDTAKPINSSGYLEGIIGVCNNRTYQLHHAMKTWGGWLGLVVIIVLFVMMGTHGTTWGKGSKGKGGAKPVKKK